MSDQDRKPGSLPETKIDLSESSRIDELIPKTKTLPEKPPSNPIGVVRNSTEEKGGNFDSVETLKPGTVLKNRFKLVKRIGRGGMGTIFLAVDLRKEELQDKNPLIAVKFLNEEFHDRREAVIALQREAKKSQALSHPNIVTVYDFDREDHLFFFSMEYLRGQSFYHFICENGNRFVSNEKIMHYVELMARGLAYAHQEGFVHADFKPANVFLTENENVKILDFGIAQAVRGELTNRRGDDSVFDVSSLAALTPDYASLEMLEGERPVPADDVYSLCVVTYELLSGKFPFLVNKKRLNAQEAYEKELAVPVIPGVSSRYMRAIEKGLAYRREQRFENAGEFIDAIKPQVKIQRSVSIFISVLVLTLLLSWAVAVSLSDAAIGIEDLPNSMEEVKESILIGDEMFEQGDIDQAHKFYVQAWETGLDHARTDSRDHFKLKVILDRRVDDVTRDLISRSKVLDIDRFTLMQLELALEFLKKDDLGTLDEEITKALRNIRRRLGD